MVRVSMARSVHQERRALPWVLSALGLVIGVTVAGLGLLPVPLGYQGEAHPVQNAVQGSSEPALLPDAASVSIAENGASPVALSLVVNATGTACPPFGWTIQESTSGSDGPWTVTYSDTGGRTPLPYNITDYEDVLTAGATYWWQAIDDDSCTGNITSNTLQFQQPAVAVVAITQPTATSAELTWTNSASYGGQVTFGSYEVYEESGVPPPGALIGTISVEGDRSLLVQGLSYHTGYGFSVVTLDEYVNGAEPASQSNIATIHTPSNPLTSGPLGGPPAEDFLVIGLIGAVVLLGAATAALTVVHLRKRAK
jgi:hypothetical protein